MVGLPSEREMTGIVCSIPMNKKYTSIGQKVLLESFVNCSIRFSGTKVKKLYFDVDILLLGISGSGKLE